MPETILNIDDEPAVAAAARMRLKAAGFNVVYVSNGREGIDTARAQQPDAILLDIRMPGMDGLEVCRALKTDEATRDIPVVFISANVQEEARAAARAAGGVGYVRKPFDHVEMVSVLRSVINAETPEHCDER